MANNKSELPIWILIGLVAMMVFGNQASTGDGNGGTGEVDLCQLVDSEAQFTGQRMFLKGTAITTEYVRVIKPNGGEIKDLGQISLDSGTLSTSPKKDYNLYYGENSTTYYTSKEVYTAPCEDSTDDKVGVLCTIDTDPTVTVFDEYDQVQSATANAQAMTTDDEKSVTIRIKAAGDKCYGNPDAEENMKNALCFKYNSTAFTSVKADTSSIGLPYAVSSVYAAAGYDISCYELDLLSDLDYVDIPVTLKTGGTDEPTTGNNISIYLDDVAFDIDADSLEEIWGFQDEDNNGLGASVVTGDILYIS